MQALAAMAQQFGSLPGDVDGVMQLALKALEGADAEVRIYLPP
jgi:hypothetical protein